MDKIILKEHSKEDVKKRLVHFAIDKDEEFLIREIKKPSKFLFFKIKGEYEVIIKKKNSKHQNSNKSSKSNKINKKEVRIEKENINEENKECRLEQLAKEHFNKSNLDIQILKKQLKDNKIIFLVKGNDAREFKKSKGFINLSKMLSISTPKLKKRIEFHIQGQNNFVRKERNDFEAEVRQLARDTAKKVIETKKEKKLYGLNPAKRRIVHDELSKITNVETKSYGEDKNRYLKVSYIEGK